MSDIETIVSDLKNAHWEAMDEITRLRAENERLRKANRWNIERDGDDLVICEGTHDKSDKCEYKRWYPQGQVDCLRAELAAVTEERDRMREALKPLAGMDVELLDENKKPTGIHAFDAWHSGQVVFDIGKDRKITVNDLRRARAALEGVTEPQQSGEGNE